MIEKKPIYVFENHEMAFHYWCEAKREMEISTFFLVTFDKHTDLMEWGRQLDLRNEISQLDLNDLIKIREIASRSRTQKNNIAYRQPRVAMEAGLVGDVLLITQEVPYEKTYEDLSGQKHRIFFCTHPDNLKDCLMNDQSLKESMDYPEGNSNIILDIDLDFFTYLNEKEQAHVIDEDDFKNIFSSNSLIWWLHKKARLITIAKEPFWCGRKGNSERILKLLKTYFLGSFSSLSDE